MPYSFASPPQNGLTAIEIARTFEHTEIVVTLEEYMTIAGQEDKVCPTTSSNREGRQTGSGTK